MMGWVLLQNNFAVRSNDSLCIKRKIYSNRSGNRQNGHTSALLSLIKCQYTCMYRTKTRPVNEDFNK